MSTIKDVVQDVVKMTASLGIFSFVKVDGDDEHTKFAAIDADQTVIVNAKLHEAVADLKGNFGFGNLAFLSGISGLRGYKEDGAKVEVLQRERNGVNEPEALQFSDEFGNNDRYRLMNEVQVRSAFVEMEFNGVSEWDVVFEPTKQKVGELQEIAGIYGGIEPNFAIKTDGSDLIVTVGDSGGSYTGKRTFATGVKGSMPEGFTWPLSQFLNILKLGMTAQCTVRVSSLGVIMVNIDTGVAEYEYLLPAFS